MRDPRVVALYYRLATGPELEFSNPPPQEWETEEFRLRLEAGQARVELKKHYASVDEARRQAEPHLRSWEVDAALRESRTVIRFDYERPEVMDRNPPPTGTPILVSRTDTILLGDTISSKITRAAYPAPPRSFVASPDAKTMWDRYEAYKKGREPLGSMAYACYTLLEASVGGGRNARQKVASKYRISRNVLDKLVPLATTVGDQDTVRKFTSRKPRPHTPGEIAWIESTLRIMIRRVGECAAAPDEQHREITIADLPRT